jgi:2'-5' RNA ligase
MSNPPSSKLRLFLAVRPETDAIEALQRLIAPLRATEPGERLRWTDPENLHLTLRFFGSVSGEAPDAISAVCRDVCESSSAFSMQLAGGGAFPNVRRASVLWIGVTEGREELRALAAALNPRLDALSFAFAREERDYTPHLTIARSRQPLQLTAASASLSTVSIRSRVDRLLLVRSVLGGPSARYEILDHYPLAPA